MKNDPTTQQIKHYYERKNLSPKKLQELMDISQQQDRKKTSLASKSDRWLFKNNMSIAASIFFAFIIGTQMFFYLPTDNEALAERITKEILLNHQKQFNIEFQGNNINELRTHMQKLDFNLIQSNRITELGLEIIGTRYCSIQGEIAAQIKLKDNVGNIYTLYETALKENLKKLTDEEKTVNGLAVSTWSEHGVFFGLVGSKTR